MISMENKEKEKKPRKECMMSKGKRKKKKLFSFSYSLYFWYWCSQRHLFYGSYGKQVEELKQEAVRLVRQSDVDTFKGKSDQHCLCIGWA